VGPADSARDDELAALAWLATIGRLAGGTLHEIANPLLALTGTAELLLDEIEPGTRVATRLALVHSTGNEIGEVVRTLGGFARERHLPEADVSLVEAVSEAAALVRRLSAVKDIEIEEVYGADAVVHARRAALKQVVVSLLLDGLAARPESGTVRVAAGAEDGRAVVTVSGARPQGLAREALETVARGFGGELALDERGTRFAV
jgi:C4-dicarboxylate-specific signal transduction histidine kinase